MRTSSAKPDIARRFWRVGASIGIAAVMASAVLTLLHFPYHVDDPSDSRQRQVARVFYEDAYSSRIGYPAAQPASQPPASLGLVSDFIRRYGLENKRVLEVGAGRGSLQDVVE